MLIVDSPFPPYSPVDVNLYAEPDVGNLSGTKILTVTLGSAPSTRRFWTNDNLAGSNAGGSNFHRDGDYPAKVFPDNSLEFMKCGVRHRLHGLANVYPARRQGGITGQFYLYGKMFWQPEFLAINAFAVKHALPLWVAVMAKTFWIHLGNLDELAVATVEAMGSLQGLNVEWLVKLWGIKPSWWIWDDLEGINFEEFISGMERVIRYEQKTAQDATVSASYTFQNELV